MSSIMKITIGVIFSLFMAIVLTFTFALTGVPPTTLSAMCLLMTSGIFGVFVARKVDKF